MRGPQLYKKSSEEMNDEERVTSAYALRQEGNEILKKASTCTGREIKYWADKAELKYEEALRLLHSGLWRRDTSDKKDKNVVQQSVANDSPP